MCAVSVYLCVLWGVYCEDGFCGVLWDVCVLVYGGVWVLFHRFCVLYFSVYMLCGMCCVVLLCMCVYMLWCAVCGALFLIRLIGEVS